MKKFLPVIFLFACGINNSVASDKLLMTPEEYARQRYEVQDSVTRMLNAASPLQRRMLVNEAKRLSKLQNPEKENTQRDVNINDIADLSSYFNKDVFQTVSPDVPYHLIDTTEAVQKEEEAYHNRQAAKRAAILAEQKPASKPAKEKPKPKTFRRAFSQ